MIHLAPRQRILRVLPNVLPLFLVAVLTGAAPAAAGVDRWTPAGPPGGTVNALVVDPSRPDHLYAATARDGLYKSLDGGRRWLRLRKGLPAGGVTHVVLDRSSPATVYAAVSEKGAYALYRSLDSGDTWERRSSLPVGNSLAVGKGRSEVLFAAGREVPEVRVATVYRSLDGGASWRKVFELEVRAGIVEVVADSTSSEVVYLALDDTVLKSTDSGSTWDDVGPMSPGEPQESLTSLAVVPSKADLLYAFGSSSVFRSEDGGMGWRSVGRAPCGRVGRVAEHPREPGTLYAVCSPYLVWSDDGGATWVRVREDPPWVPSALRTFAIDPVPNGWNLYVGTADLGIYKSGDDGYSWRRAGEGLRGQVVASLAFDALSSRGLYAVTAGAGPPPGSYRSRLWRTFDSGATWSPWLPDLEEAINQVVADPYRPGRLYLATLGGIYRWEKGTGNLHRIWTNPVDKIVTDPVDPDRLYGVRSDSVESALFCTEDGGATWWKSLVFPWDTGYLGPEIIRRVIPDPSLPGRLYATKSKWVPETNDTLYTLYRSDDGGRSWRVGSTVPGADLHLGAAGAPGMPSELYTSSDRTYSSSDGGKSWQETDFPGALVLVVPGQPLTLYAQGENAAFRSRDGGRTWEALEGLEDLCSESEIVMAHPAAPERLYRYRVPGFSGVQEAQAVGARPLVLQGGRFEARAAWRDDEGRYGAARPTAVSDQAGVFALPGRQRLLAAFDLLDDRASSGHFSVLGASLLPMEATVTLTDRATGLSRDFFFPPAPAVSHVDLDSFPPLPESAGWEPMSGGGALPGDFAMPWAGAGSASPSLCEPSSTAVCLLDGRFGVEVFQQSGEGGTRWAPMARTARIAPLLWESGIAWFEDPGTMSVVVQMVDGQAINGSFWVLIGGLSEAPYRVRVWDGWTGSVRSYFHPSGPPASVADLGAF